jgi:alpha-glucosidase
MKKNRKSSRPNQPALFPLAAKRLCKTMTEWWRGGVFYQIYPRSFMDSNDDGVGDLSGVIQKLDYVASLGIDAIWLSPFFKSPMKDFGYDVEDYRSVDPLFGTLDDFRRLLSEAHKRNIKIIIDQVWAHTADTHPWFVESRQNRTNAKADWYIWSDSKPDGTPPNNWLSVFGGPCWTWDTRREQYYLHHYLVSQPKLNLRNPDVKAAIFDIAKFWLDMGVDGFRLDTVHHFLHDPELRDNPARDHNSPPPNDIPSSNPLSRQFRLHCCAHDDTTEFLEELRTLINIYNDRILLGEVGGEDNEALACRYVQTGKRMHLAYTFGLMQQKFDKELVQNIVNHIEDLLKDGWLCWATGNHDNMRVVSRWPHHNISSEMFARFCLAFGLSLRGTFCMYQGEELALPEAEVPFELLQDPYGITFYPEYKGRDGCRTPMTWLKDSSHGGFSNTTGRTWLPVPEPHREHAVDSQQNDPNSMLNFTRAFIAWRKEQPALRFGNIHFIETPDNVIGFRRQFEQQTLTCLFNAQDQPVTLPVQGQLSGMSSSSCLIDQGKLTLTPYSFAFLT